MPLPDYPVAADGHAALALLKAGEGPRAVREKEAESLAGYRVAFVTQSIGPLFEQEGEARAAYASMIGDDRICTLTCRIKAARGGKPKAVQPAFEDGARWPKTQAVRASLWQLSISYWKVLPGKRAAATGLPGEQARKLRKTGKGQALTPEQLMALAASPLTATRPQKALDFGLFDFIPPDDPGIVIADE